MIIFTVFFILLIISTHKADGFCFHNKYYTAVGGSIYCKYSSKGYAYVFITKQPRSFHERHPPAQKCVNYSRSFDLSAKVSGYWKPRLFLKIIHNCVETNFIKHKKPILKKYVEEIPQLLISKNRPNQCFYYRGIIDLSQNKRRRN